MAQTELQTEFMEFVTQIIEQINKDIYIEDLKKIYDSYLNCLNSLNAESEYIAKVSCTMHENQMEAVHAITNIQKNFEEQTKQIESALSVFYNAYEKIMQKYENRIITLHQDERQTFTEELQNVLQDAQTVNLRKTEEIFTEYTEKLQKMSNSVAQAKELEKIVSEMAQTKEVLQNSVSTTYLKTLTRFEERIADLNVEERKALSITMKELFQEESEKLKGVISEYETILNNVSAKMMTHQDIEVFKQSMAQYTHSIQYLAEQRYSEGIRAFEARLSQIGKLQFEKYLETINHTALKASDLEAFSEQIKLLALSMKKILQTSENSYLQIFEQIKNNIELLNGEESEKFIKTLNGFFSEQMLRLNEIFDRHEQIMERYEKEQKNVLWTVEKMEDALEENAQNIKELLKFVKGVKGIEEHLDSKINLLQDKIEQQTLRQELLFQKLENSTKNMNALFILNVIQFFIVIVLFFVNGKPDFSGILEKIIILVIVLIGGIIVLKRKK